MIPVFFSSENNNYQTKKKVELKIPIPEQSKNTEINKISCSYCTKLFV